MHLVTTADERSWPEKDKALLLNEPIIFLGEWCKNPARKQIWYSMSAMVSEPYGLNPKQKIIDNDEKHRLYNALIKELNSFIFLDKFSKLFEKIKLFFSKIKFTKKLFSLNFT